MATYFTLLTKIGQAKLANAQALGKVVQWTAMALGDGNGNPTTPIDTKTGLVHEVYRANINQLSVDSENPNYLIAELIVPTSVGGWFVHEVGIFDADGDLVAIANFPATYKPAIAEGSGRDLIVRIIIQVANTGTVTLKVDPAVILASQKWVVENFSKAKLLPGGKKDQVLAKVSDTNGDADWRDMDGMPKGGTTGQALVKKSDADSDVEWGKAGGDEVVVASPDVLGIVRPDMSTIIVGTEQVDDRMGGFKTQSTGVLSVPVGSAATQEMAGDLGLLALAPVQDSTSTNLAATPAGAYWIAMNLSTLGHSGEEQFITSSGTWTAPYNGVYTFMQVGGGGGGGGAGPRFNDARGGDGGASGAQIFSLSLSAGTPVSISIGAGGVGGAGNPNGNAGEGYPAGSGGAGGTTTIVVSGTAYSIAGGSGGAGGAVYYYSGEYAIYAGAAGAPGTNSSLNPYPTQYGKGGTGARVCTGSGSAGLAGFIRISW